MLLFPHTDNVQDQDITALYGTFHMDMSPADTIEVSNYVKKFIIGNVFRLPKNENFRTKFKQISGKRRCYLQIRLADKTYNIADDQYKDDIVIDLDEKSNRIKIVYFLYTNPNSNWRAIVSGQLLQLSSYGILSEADLYIHIADPYNIVDDIVQLIKKITPLAIINISYKNQYEYPGIKLVHDLARQFPDHNFIYFHSKGMSYNLHSRPLEEITLFNKTFENWRKNLQFLNFNGIKKIGLLPAKEDGTKKKARGWIWYNFWYATGEYLSECQEPVITDDRYYYEEWLACHQSDKPVFSDDCLSLFKVNLLDKTYFTSTEAFYYVNLMQLMETGHGKNTVRFLQNSFLIYLYLKINSLILKTRNSKLSY